jgi:DNA polymerase elongation subunit (family B)
MSESPTIVGYECKHITYVEAQDHTRNDLLCLKLNTHHADGTIIPTLKYLENFRRPFWVTRELHRNHKDKKEWELLSKLQEFKSTQIDLVKNAALALGKPVPMNGQIRFLARSPYLYGCDISTPAIVKYLYMQKFRDLQSRNSVAVSDTETDMLGQHPHGQEPIIMQALTMRERVYVAIVKSYFEGWDLTTVEAKIQAAARQYMGQTMEDRKIQIEVELVDTEAEIVSNILKRAHQWQPDFLTFWNMDFDITKMDTAFQRHGYNHASEWSAPSVPERYRYYNYKRGPNQKKTASGHVMPLSPAEQWHTVTAPASFYVIDAMCVYQKLRIAGGKAPNGYSLNAILKDELKNVQKMHFAETDHLKDADWHREMQRNYKIEYVIYNIFDCVSVELLDEKTTDLAMQISMQCEHSEYRNFPSQPRRTCDDFHFYVQQQDPPRICATTSDNMTVEDDSLTLGLDNWVVALRADLTLIDGYDGIEELPGHKTTMYPFSGDLDLASTYPSEIISFNIARETTRREVASIVGCSESLQRATGINLSGGYVNAVEHYTSVYKAPTFDQVLAHYRGEDLLPAEFDTYMRQRMSEMESVEELSFESDVSEDEDETV